jgi:polyisoprenoid-binding protein YceI
MIRLGPATAACHVLTFREGLLSGLGHDLELAVTRFDVEVDETARTVHARFDATSLRVERALRDGVPLADGLSASDRLAIEDHVRKDVLDAGRYPEVRFRSTRVVDVADGFDVRGVLALHGRERDVAVALRRTGERYAADVRLHQPDFGIRPYSALLGAIRVKPDVIVRLSLPVAPPRGAGPGC